MESRLVIKTCLLVLFAWESYATVFTEQPGDVTVTEGGDAIFRCGTDLSCSFFYWGRYQTPGGDFSYVSKCLTSYEPKYSIQREGNVYSLRVRSVSLEDSGVVYECWQYSQAGGGWLKSSNATLTVVPQTTTLLGSEPPVCSMDPPGPHEVGDMVSLACSYQDTTEQIPVNRLSWTAGKQGSEFTGNKQGNSRVVWTLSETDNFREFTCRPVTRITDPSTPSRANCTLIPLAVPTNVSISPPVSQAVMEGGEVVFNCSAKAIPEATAYTWVLTKDGAMLEPSRRFIISGRTLRILRASGEDDGITVVCEASNEINITGCSLPYRITIRPSPTLETARTDQPATKKGKKITIRPSPTPGTARTDQPATKKGKKSAKNPKELTQWSHMALVIGIMLCIVVLFVAAGMGVMYAHWRRRMNGKGDATPASPSPKGQTTFSLDDPEADIMLGDGCVRACAVASDGSPLGRQSVLENLYTENVYMEILGQPHPCAPAPAHERAVENEPTYEKHIY